MVQVRHEHQDDLAAAFLIAQAVSSASQAIDIYLCRVVSIA